MTGPDMVAARWAAIEMAEKRCRQQMRLIAPVVDQMPQLYPKLVHSMDQYFAIKKCNICNPPAKTFKCAICDTVFDERWQWQSHVRSRLSWCEKAGKRKERAWANKVGLDG